jgi:hypothetical protein
MLNFAFAQLTETFAFEHFENFLFLRLSYFCILGDVVSHHAFYLSLCFPSRSIARVILDVQYVRDVVSYVA